MSEKVLMNMRGSQGPDNGLAGHGEESEFYSKNK